MCHASSAHLWWKLGCPSITLASCPIQPPFWKRYVDDTLTALPRDNIKQFHQHVNSIEASIQFTVEEESDALSRS